MTTTKPYVLRVASQLLFAAAILQLWALPHMSVAEAQETRRVPTSKPGVDISGTWAGKNYYCGGSILRQIVRIKVTGTSAVATKLVGDACIHEGDVTWTATVNGSGTIPMRLHQTDGPDRPAYWTDTTLVIVNADELSVPSSSIAFYRFPCNDPDLPLNDDYDKDDPDHHRYQRIGFICWSWESPQCTVDAVFDVMTRTVPAIAPAYPERQAVTNCATLKVFSKGYKTAHLSYGYGDENKVRTAIDKASYSITNYTQRGHIFYPGQIRREVVFTNDRGECLWKMLTDEKLIVSTALFDKGFCVMVHTVGEGTGDFPLPDKLLGKYVIFPEADRVLRKAWVQELRGTGFPEPSRTPP